MARQNIIKSILDKLWFKIRKKIVSRRHARIAKFLNPFIDEYFDGKIEKNTLRQKKVLKGKIIWQYWGQAVERKDLPPVVLRCFDSVDRYKGDYQVIRLNDKTVREYLDFPDFVWQAQGEPKFSRVYFSDLLRIALLHVYGGVWLDATILLTEPLPKKYADLPYFLFQRSDEEPNKAFWEGPHTSYWSWNPGYRVKMLNSIIFAQKENKMIGTLLDLILHYWKTQEKIINYFFFQILYHELVNGPLKELQCPIVSDTWPHVLRVLVDGNDDYMPLDELLAKVGVHKLTYFDDIRTKKLDGLIARATKLKL